MSVIDNWIEKNKNKAKDKNELDHVRDFLEKNYSKKKSINFSYNDAVLKAEQWIIELNKKTSINPGMVETVMGFPSGNKIVKLLDQSSKDWEGFWMKHCVSSYSEHEGIYSLRDSFNKPHCTIEIKNNKVIQIKGKANSSVKQKYIDEIFEFISNQRLDVLLDQFNNIGFVYYSKELKRVMESHFTGFQIIIYNNRELLKIEKWNLIKGFPYSREFVYLELLKILIREEQNLDVYKNLIEAFDFGSKNNFLFFLRDIISFSKNVDFLKIAVNNNFFKLKLYEDHLLINDMLYLATINKKSEFLTFLIKNCGASFETMDKTQFILLLKTISYHDNSDKIYDLLKDSINDKNIHDGILLKYSNKTKNI